MKPFEIRQALTTEKSDALDRRRKVILLSVIGLVDFSIISLYQTGIIKRLPDLPYKIFDSNKVNKAPEAYALGVPDGPISAAVYSATMLLAAAVGSENSGRKPVFDVMLGGAILGNTAGAAFYLYDMIFKQKKICLYCVAGAVINFASAVIIAPVVTKGFKKLFGRS
jgi:uncharacterized membrane protein